MRKIILIPLLTFLPALLFGQNAPYGHGTSLANIADSSGFGVTVSKAGANNVYIGGTLEVTGGLAGNVVVNLTSSDSLTIDNTGGANATPFRVVNDVSGGDSSVVVLADGNMGIGTISPTSKLVVNDPNMGYVSFLEASATNYARLKIETTTPSKSAILDIVAPKNANILFWPNALVKWGIKADQSDNFIWYDYGRSDDVLVLESNGNNYFKNGSLGIGTASPTAILTTVDNDTLAYAGVQPTTYAAPRDAFWFSAAGDTAFIKINGTTRYWLTTAGGGH